MARIFISHNSNDAKEAVALKQWLSDTGWNDVFLDIDAKDGLSPGERWKDALKSAADRCEAVLCMVSPTWLSSPECKLEFRYAETLHKHLFLAIIKPCKTQELPPDWQWCPLYGDGTPTTIRFDFREQPAECIFLADGLERLKNGLLKAGISAEHFPWPPENDPDRAPYRGLKPLEAADAAVFFGRNAQILHGMETLWDMRRNGIERLLVILGASGSGKSSFMQAGLLPRLARDDRQFFPLPVIRPRNAVLFGAEGMAPAVTTAFTQLGRKITLGEIERELNSGPHAFEALLTDLEQRLLNRIAGETDKLPPTIVIPIDQAEELFNPDGIEEASRFLTLLATLLAEVNSSDQARGAAGSQARVVVVLTIRSDRYERLQLAPGLSSIKPRLYDLRPFPPGQFERVINGPAERATNAGRKLTIDSRLTERLLADFSEGADTLPLLGFALEKLYHKYGNDGDLTLEEYENIRGGHDTVQAAIFQEAIDTALKEPYRPPVIPAGRAEQYQALRCTFIPFLARINPENNEPLRQVARLAEMPAEVHPLVERLVEARLLIRDKDTIEVAHESLLRQWPSLRGWLTEDQDKLRLLGNIRNSTAEWKKEDRRDDLLVHRNGRLKDAETLLATPGYVVSVDSDERAYMNACTSAQQAREAEEKEEQERRIRDAERIAEEQKKAAVAAEAARVAEEKRRVEADAFATRSRNQTRIAGGIAVVAILFFFGAIWSTYQANERLIATDASVLWHPLNFSGREVDEKQATGLLALARSDDRRKRAFLEKMLESESLSEQFNNQPNAILSASVGISPKSQNWLLKRLYKVPPENETRPEIRVARALAVVELEGKLAPEGLISAILSTQNPSQLEILGKGVVALTNKVQKLQAGAMMDKFTSAIQSTMDSRRLKLLGQGLSALPGELSEPGMMALYHHFLKAIKAEEELGITSYSEELGEGLAAVARKVPEEKAEALTDEFIDTIKSRRGLVPDFFSVAVGQGGMVVLAGKVPPRRASAVVEKFLGPTMEDDGNEVLGQGLVAVARNVPEADAEGVVLKFLAAMGAHDDYPIQRVLGLGLANLVSKLSGSQAEAVAKELVSLTQSSTDAYKLEGLGLSLGALPVKLTELQADIATKKFLSAISAAENKNQLDALSHGVTAVVSKVPYTMAGAVLEAFVSAAVDTKTKSTDQLEAFGRGMAALPINLSGEKVGKVIDKFMLIQSELFFESKSLGPGVVAVIGKVVDAQAQDVMDNFVNAILATENPNILNTLGIAVSALPLGLSQTQSEAVAAKYLAEIRSSTKVDFSHTDKMDYAWDQNHEIQRQKNLYVLGEGFAALAGKMHESQAAEVIQNLLVELQSMKDYFQSKALTGAMVAVAGQVPEVDARDVTKVILSAIKGTQDSDLLEALGKCLAAVAGKMPQAQASELTKAFVSTIEATQNLSQLEAVGQGFAAVAPRIADDDQAAIILFEAMKNPLIPRDPITAAIRKRFPEAPPKEKGFWTLIEWADKEKHFQGLDLEAPLAQPSNITAGTTPPGIPMANEIKRN